MGQAVIDVKKIRSISVKIYNIKKTRNSLFFDNLVLKCYNLFVFKKRGTRGVK